MPDARADQLALQLVAALKEFLGGEVGEMRGEIQRSTSLLRDANEKLSASFRDMEAQTRTQRTMITGLVEPGPDGGVGGGSPGVRRFAEEAGRLIGDLAQVTAESGRESVRTVQSMDETQKHLDEVFALVGRLEHVDPAMQERIRSLVAGSKAAVERVRERIEATAEREMSASIDAKIRADALIAQVHAINRSLAEGMNTIGHCSNHIREAVLTAIRSLQFEDITTQSLAAATTHLDRLSAINEKVAPVQDAFAEVAPDARLRALEDFGQYLQRLRENAVRPVRRPVTQVDMRSGPVDLF